MSCTNCSAASSSYFDQEANVWGDGGDEGALFSTFVDFLSESPSLCLSRYGEQNSWCLDIFTLGHNAVRNELSDMFVLYRSMADIGASLTHGNVKASTLWFRAFYKFTILNVLSWHKEHLFPWVHLAAQLDKDEEGKMASMYKHRDKVEDLLRALYERQARLSSQLSRDANLELVRVQFVDVVCGAVDLAFKITDYFTAVETQIVPILDVNGLNKQDRDALFMKLCLLIQEAGTEQIDIPMLIMWMPRAVLREWLTTCAVDHRNRPIPLWMYNSWQTDHYHERHRKLVEDIVAKAKCS